VPGSSSSSSSSSSLLLSSSLVVVSGFGLVFVLDAMCSRERS
jgi:hypothetical protein